MEVVCPDCGKIIAPEGAVDSSARCRCGDSPVMSTTEPVSSEETKTCFVCGCDLTARLRFKDHLGRYWCRECRDADERVQKRAEELLCADCGRMFGAGKLFEFNADKLCRSCYDRRMAETEKKLIRMGHEASVRHKEVMKTKLVAAALILLLLMAAVGRWVF